MAVELSAGHQESREAPAPSIPRNAAPPARKLPLGPRPEAAPVMTTPHARNPAARRRRDAFTLLELLVVIAIIGVLGAIVGLNLIGAADRAKASATRTTMKGVQAGLKAYYVQYSAYPTSQMGLQHLVAMQFITGFNDGWGRPLDYYSPTQTAAYELWSLGADGAPQTADDIQFTDTTTP